MKWTPWVSPGRDQRCGGGPRDRRVKPRQLQERPSKAKTGKRPSDLSQGGRSAGGNPSGHVRHVLKRGPRRQTRCRRRGGGEAGVRERSVVANET